MTSPCSDEIFILEDTLTRYSVMRIQPPRVKKAGKSSSSYVANPLNQVLNRHSDVPLKNWRHTKTN